MVRSVFSSQYCEAHGTQVNLSRKIAWTGATLIKVKDVVLRRKYWWHAGVSGDRQPSNPALARKSSFIKRLETIRVAWKSKNHITARCVNNQRHFVKGSVAT